MAFSSHKDPNFLKEWQSDHKVLKTQIAELCELIQSSKHIVFFTGAGISTSTGIPDFRGPKGVWTLKAQGKKAESKVSTICAHPTPAHMAIVQLEKQGKMQFLISQNTDGIHRRSGFPVIYPDLGFKQLKPSKLAELHGNSNLETCKNCGNDYLRDFKTRARNMDVHKHESGRICQCGFPLYDTIINFGEDLPEKPLENGFEHAENADLMIVLGSSLTVTPACDMPKLAAEKGAKLVICNLQKTKLDKLCALRIFCKTDDLMIGVMQRLRLNIPCWQLSRIIRIELFSINGDGAKSNELRIKIKGVEKDGTPATFIKSLQIGTKTLVKEPYSLTHPRSNFSIKLEFMGHFSEPNNEIFIEVTKYTSNCVIDCYMSLDFTTGMWNNVMKNVL